MHICLPDTREFKPPNGSAFILYNVHIDGLYHCSLRYKQLLHLHLSLAKKFNHNSSLNGLFNPHQLPPFPPKKLLPMSTGQLEERRLQLEKYLQNISQNKAISSSTIFNLFLLEAQRESTLIRADQAYLDIELVNGRKIRLQIYTHDSAESVLTAVCRALGLDDRYHAYFCLCLCGYDVVRDKLIIKRRLSFFESPYVTLQTAVQQQEQLQNALSNSNNSTTATHSSSSSQQVGNLNNCRCLSCCQQQSSSASTSTPTTGVPLVRSSNGHSNQQQSHYNNNNFNNQHHSHQNGNESRQLVLSNSSTSSSTTSTSFVTHRILLRKSYWDPVYDTYILNDQKALNLLFIQTVYDIKHSLMFVDRETYHQLESLLASDSKLEYILLARTLKYYNYVHFEPCLSDYPRPKTKVMISIGSKDLNMRVLKSPRKSLSTTATTSSATAAAAAASSSGSGSGSSADNQHILYCTSSLVPNGYHHLITKDEIVEEEYNFKVPLIRCWRLTSVETLSNNNNVAQPASSNWCGTGNSVKRKSFSLFNSVIGTSRSNNNNNNVNEDLTSGDQQQQRRGSVISSGSGGVSLFAALTSSTGNHANGAQPSDSNPGSGSGSDQEVEAGEHTVFSQHELSFEYLFAKDKLRWITVSSDQAIFISISLQGVVDELVSKRDGRCSLYQRIVDASGALSPAPPTDGQDQPDLTSAATCSSKSLSFTYMTRDGSQRALSASSQQLFKFGPSLGYAPSMNPYALALARQRQQVRASALLASANSRFGYNGNVASPSSSHHSNAANSGTSSGVSSTSRWFGTSSESSGGGARFGLGFNSGYNQPYHHSAGGGYEILNFKKAPSPIINDAFEGVSIDDDL